MSGFQKLLLILILISGCGNYIKAQNESLKIGDSTFSLNEIQKITFSGGNSDMSIQFKNGNLTEYPFTTIYITAGPSSVNPAIESNRPELYPNPVSDFLHIKNNEPIGRILIYDVTGTLVGEYSTNESYISIDFSTLKSGFYLVKTNNFSGKIVKK